MTDASAKELFVLGRVSMRPTHGHEIMRTLRASRSDLWVELSKKHVYYVLRKLENEGLVDSVEERDGNLPARKVFSITDAGRAELVRMLHAENLLHAVAYSDFDIVVGLLAYTDALDDASKSAILLRRREYLRDLISDARSAEAEAGARPDAGAIQRLTLDKVARMATAELDWLDDIIVEVESNGWASMRPVVDATQQGGDVS